MRHRQFRHLTVISILFLCAFAVGLVVFLSLEFFTIPLAELNVVKPSALIDELLGPTYWVTILEGSSVEGVHTYEPSQLVVEKGDIIIWTNADSIPHTVTSGRDPDDPEFSLLFYSKRIDAKEKFLLDTTKLEPRQYEYFCIFHSHMKAMFTVADAGAHEELAKQDIAEIPTLKEKLVLSTGAIEILGAADQGNVRFYAPPEITIETGTTVVWTNRDTQGHTVTSGNARDLGARTLFDSSFPLIKTGEMFRHTFYIAGEYPYFCQAHPWMVGKVIVVRKN